MCNYDNFTCWYQGECRFNRNDWQSFHFNFLGDRAYEIAPSAYLMDFVDASGFNMCRVNIFGNRFHNDEYIIGDVFMQSLYVMLDYENSQFAVNGNFISVAQLGEK